LGWETFFSVGTCSQEISIPGKYEISKEIVAKAIVNALGQRYHAIHL